MENFGFDDVALCRTAGSRDSPDPFGGAIDLIKIVGRMSIARKGLLSLPLLLARKVNDQGNMNQGLQERSSVTLIALGE